MQIGSEDPILPHDRTDTRHIDTSMKRKVPGRTKTIWNYKRKEDVWRDRSIWKRCHDRNCDHDQITDRDVKTRPMWTN
jgi:hypothetical protein